MTIDQLFGESVTEWGRLKCAMDKANLTIPDLILWLEDEVASLAEERARAIKAEAALDRISKIVSRAMSHN